MTSTRRLRAFALALILNVVLPAALRPRAAAQTPAPTTNAIPRQSGTVKAVTPRDFVLTTATGQDFAVTVPAGARILLVPPGSRDLSSAQPGTMGDVAAGDRAIVNGSSGDSGPMLTATRVIVMKSGAIAASRQAEEVAWTRGVGGIVQSVDPAAGAVVLSGGMRTVTVRVTPATIVRRYAMGSVRFADAVRSTVAEIRPGDQLRARGTRSPDGSSLTADEIVTGTFGHFSGVLSSVNPAAGTVTLKDLASKRVVTVAVTGETDLRRLPPGMGRAIASHSRPGNAGDASRAEAADARAGAAGSAGEYHRGGGAGADLSRLIHRLPGTSLGDLKAGDAVMIVASGHGESGEPTAVTLLSGVEEILAAHPAGETTLSPWSLGGESAEGDAASTGGGTGPQ